MYKRICFIAFLSSLFLGTSFSATAKKAPSPVALLKKYQKKATSQREINNEKDTVEMNISLTKAEYKNLTQTLIDSYGEPKITRNSLQTWEISNSEYSRGQAKLITVTTEKNRDEYFAKLDRKKMSKGNNPRRLNKNKTKPSSKNKKLKRSQRKSKAVLNSNERD